MAARNGEGASLVECKTYRQGPHCMVVSESRSKNDEEKKWENIDPVLGYEKKLISQKILDKNEVEKLKKEVIQIIDEAVIFAEKSSYPEVKDLYKYVYKD